MALLYFTIHPKPDFIRSLQPSRSREDIVWDSSSTRTGEQRDALGWNKSKGWTDLEKQSKA
jgi:hypothetical protein